MKSIGRQSKLLDWYMVYYIDTIYHLDHLMVLDICTNIYFYYLLSLFFGTGTQESPQMGRGNPHLGMDRPHTCEEWDACVLTLG